ncbi:MAG: DUF1501 domain-containing protein [Planctomycetes bacterium]|nr:DUF1501 domain-containing protein [Planctomycetota bacterium]
MSRSFLDSGSRRAFLARGLGAIGVGAAIPEFVLRTAAAAPEPAESADRVLVVVQLSGGHDAISALVPYGHEEYAKVRQATRIADDQVLKINEELGLHPNLKGWKELLDQGAFAAVPGVGYPNTNYSHFTATEIWFAADPKGRDVGSGWLGRACDACLGEHRDQIPMIAVGTEKSPLSLSGKIQAAVCFNDPQSFRYRGDRNDPRRAELYKAMSQSVPEGAPGSVEWIARASAVANDASARIRRLASSYASKVDYPTTGLGRNLRVIAGLVSGGLGTRVYWTSIGGFDTHRGQRQRHDTLMTQLNDAIFAFQNDLAQQGQADRVVTITMSEFGRRVKENGSEGTDHGAAAAMFLFGSKLKAGVHGTHPSLTDLQGGGGGSLKHTVDFRSVYGTLLDGWLGVSSESVLGASFPGVDLLA